MNRATKNEVLRLRGEGIEPKAAYNLAKILRNTGYRNPANTTATENRRLARRAERKANSKEA